MAGQFSSIPNSSSYSSADIYGTRVNPVTLADPYAELSAIYPNLGQTNNAISAETLRMIQGTDPNLPILAQNTGASRGAALGVPGSQFADRMGDLSLYDRLAQQRQQGISNYNQTVPTISATQTNSPALQAQTQSQNNIWAASPDPAAASQEALKLYQQQLNQLAGSYSSPSVSRVQSPSMAPIPQFNAGPTAPSYFTQPTQANTQTSASPTNWNNVQSATAPAQDQMWNSWFQDYGGAANQGFDVPVSNTVDGYANAANAGWWA